MNYIRQINAFYDWLETNSLSDSAIVLWHALMHINNRAGWIMEFAVAISTLETKTGLKKDAIIRARNRLQQVGRIDFKSRSGQQSALYSIKPFEDCDVLNDTNCDTNRNTNRELTATLTATQTASITKLNETKLKKRKKTSKERKLASKIQFAEFVTMTQEEYDKLVERFGKEDADAMIEILDNAKGANDKLVYSSDYRAILKWVVDALKKRKSQTKNPDDWIPFEPSCGKGGVP